MCSKCFDLRFQTTWPPTQLVCARSLARNLQLVRLPKSWYAGKVFNIDDYHQRYIALEVLYVGWQYMGSTYQPNEPSTVEVKSEPHAYRYKYDTSFQHVHEKHLPAAVS